MFMLYFICSPKVITGSNGFNLTTIQRLAGQPTPILHMYLYPLLLDRTIIKSIICIMSRYFYIFDMEMHDIFVVTSLPVM